MKILRMIQNKQANNDNNNNNNNDNDNNNNNNNGDVMEIEQSCML